MKNELSPKIKKVEISKRLNDSPAIVVGQLSSGLRQVMAMLDKQNNEMMDQSLTLEVNPSHDIIVKLNEMRKTDIQVANMVARQVLDNALLSAGMVSDIKQVVQRINQLILHVYDSHSGENVNLKRDVEAEREAELNSIVEEMEKDESFQREF